MRPVDARLLRHARAARGYLIFTIGLGLVLTALVLAQAGLLAHALATAARDTGPAALAAALAALLAVILARALASYGGEVAALRAAAAVKSSLRRKLTAHALRLGPAWLGSQQAGEITTLATRGLDALDPYFARFLPQLVLAVAVPVAVLARVSAADWISGVVIGVTLPLIPVFAVLVGLQTRARTQRQWQLLARLGGHFLDVVEGLPTLKIFRRATAQAEVIREVTGAHRKATMATLRLAFLSALVLELAAALATALVAVEVGLRLLAGHMGYETALLVLLLTPEAYLPLRAVGAQFHASMEGVAAAGRACDILEIAPTPGRRPGPRAAPRPGLLSVPITLNAITLTYHHRDAPALDGVSLEIRPGERVTLTGPSGAGKSSLLALLLRFAEPDSGSVEVGGIGLAELDADSWRRQIAWVPQRPHLFAGTVAANIALGQPGASDVAIERAAHLAGAAEFIEDLPQGYATTLGDRAGRLSAGQRQRLALARAFLRDAPLLLLDEPAAHLDPVTGQLILDTIETAMAGRTVVLVTHGRGWSGSGGAGRVIAMDHGKIVPGPQASQGPGADRTATLAAGAPPVLVGGTGAVSGGEAPGVWGEAPGVRGEAPGVRGEAPGVLGEAAGGSAGAPKARVALLRLLWLAGPLRGRLLVAVLAGAAATGCGVALLAVSGFLLARASQHPNVVAVTVAVVAVRALSIGRGVFRYGERLASHDVAFRVLADVRVRVYRRLERLAPAGLAEFRAGDLLARLVSDVDATQDLFIRGVSPPLTALVVGAGAATTCLLVLSPAGAVLAAGLIVAGVAVPWLAAVRARQAARRSAPARGELASQVTDLLAGAADATAFGAQEAVLARAWAADRDLARLAGTSASGAGLGTGLSAAVAGITLWGVLLLGVAAVSAGTLTRVPLAVITLTALAAFEAVTVLPAAAVQFGQAGASAVRVTAVLDAPDPVREPAVPRPLPVAPVRVTLRGAQVRYSPGGPLAIDGVDLDLAPGRRVALVGPSGAGKSTVAAVLLRFCDLAGGTATLGDADLAEYSADDVRAVIGGCAQDPHLFDTTIRENIRLARPGADQDALDSAAERARLLPWIRSLPLGWETPVGAHGAVVSGGERQRIALARALLADPPLMILDEPAAHLDPENRRELMADLLAVTEGRGVLLITHDLAGLHLLDEIVVLDRGEVAGRGTHRELLLSCDFYRRMWEQGTVREPAGSGRSLAWETTGS